MRYLFSAALVLCSLPGICQLFAPADYPRNYFRDPLAIPMSLAANFGELRPNHYHMGLDIRTQHRENLPVFAAADGYVARVSVEPFGFGQAVYINHPNGFTTVYGHLNRFFPALAAYIHKEQYRRRSWKIYLELPPSLFPVHKGDLIAYSGNTGGSQGPHLHFEIRRTAGDVNLNPLLFGLPVPDHTSPVISHLAWYDRSKSVYEQSPHLLAVTAQKENMPDNTHGEEKFTITPRVLTVPIAHIGFALQAFDTQSGSANPNGIFEADLFMDERLIIGFQMDKISYDNTRNINAHIDYKTRLTGGPFLQQLFFLSGYPLPSIYAVPNGPGGRSADPAALIAAGGHPPDGALDIGDGRPHAIRIEIRDTYGNTSRLSFEVQYKPSLTSTDVFVDSPAKSSVSAEGRVPFGDTAHAMHARRFYPGMVDGLEGPDCSFYLGEKSLYDSVTIGTIVAGYPGSGQKSTEASSTRTDIGASLPGGVSPAYAIGDPSIPLLEPVLVRMQYPRTLHADSLAVGASAALSDVDHVVMVCFNGADKDVQRPQWNEGWASAHFHAFGYFQLVDDRTPPVITPLQPLEGANLARAARIAFSVKDDLGALRDFTAQLDGSWLCFTNDKAQAYIYIFDEHCPPGSHTLKVTATDVAGNKTTTAYHFTR